mgnify:CR=1 FL=1
MADVNTQFLTPDQVSNIEKANQFVADNSKNIADQTTLDQVQKTLLKRSGLVSSADTGLEKQIKDFVSNQTKSINDTNALNTKKIESQFNRDITAQTDAFAQQRTSFQEAQRGFATNTAALNALDVRTEKSLRDLKQREQELIMSGDISAAKQTRDIQQQAIDFRQKAEQQTFTNLLGIGRFGLQVKQEQRLQDQIDAGNTKIVGNPKDGIFSITTDALGNSKIETLISAQPQQTKGESFLSLNDIEKLNDRGAIFKDPITGEQRNYQIGDKISSVTNVGGSTTKPDLKQVRAAGFNMAQQFVVSGNENTFNPLRTFIKRFKVPQGESTAKIRKIVKSFFGEDKTTLSRIEFSIFLSAETGLSGKETENIIKLIEQQ